MRNTRIAVAFTLLALVTTVAARWFEPDHRYTFGHPDWVDRAVWSQLWLLCLTHLWIAALMWVQRRSWLPSERAMFVFVAVKCIFWGNIASAYQFRGAGIRLDIACLYVFMLTATAWLDYRMFRRYVMGDEQDGAR